MSDSHVHKKQRAKNKFFKELLLITVSLSVVIVALLISFLASIQLPDFNNFADRKVVESTKIYDRTGKVLLYDVHQDIKRTVVPFEDISPYIKKATVAIEDANFYSHGGIDPKSILRAIWATTHWRD